MENYHADILDSILQSLSHPKSTISKRATQCLGSLAIVSEDAILNHLIEFTLGQMEGSSGASDKKVFEHVFYTFLEIFL